MRQAPRTSTVHLRAIVAAALALGLVLAITALAWAAPSLSIDSGPIGPTSDAMPVFGFTADLGTTVECSIDQGAPAYGPCSGATTHAPDAPLPDGDYTFRVRATDGADEQTVETRTFSVDTTPPSLSIDSGPSGPTSDATPSFGFAAEAGATVECSIDQGAPAYGPCSGATTHVPDAPLADGDYVFRVRATDGVGNQASASQAFSVDTTPPAVSVDSGPTGPTSDATPSFGFSAEAGATVECSVDHGTPAYGPCTTSTSHTVVAPLADGSYVFRVRATDAAGNRASASQAFSVDTTPPSLSIDSGPSRPTNDATPSFGFTAGAGATTVECSVDQGTPAYGPCTTSTSHTVVAPLADGSYVFRVRASDALGNEAVLTRSFSVDTVAPAVGVVSGPSGPTNDRTPSFGFTAEVGARVECSVDHGTPAYGPCTTSSSHSVQAPLADGSYVFRVRATDAAGNRASASQAFSVDSAAPSLSIDSGPSGPTRDVTPSFGFTAAVGTTVECSLDQGTPAYGPCTSATTHVAGTPLPDGTYAFRVRATDGIGNQAVASRTFTVDTTPPSLSIGLGPSGPTRDVTPLFNFSGEAGATVACSVDKGTPAFGSCTSATTYAVVGALADGTYVFHVRATDAAGNQTTVTRTFTVDTVAPSLSIGFGPSGTTSDSTPLFGFSAEVGATVECSIDQGAPAYGPCASATTHAASAPLANGSYVFRVRATDAAGNQTTVTRAFTVDAVAQTPDPGSPRPDPTTPPVTPPAAAPVTTPVTPAIAEPRLLSPFPLVRISGTLTATGARIRLLSVRAPRGALVRVTVTPACGGRRQSARRCRVLQAAGTVGRSDALDFRALARPYRSGTVIVVRVWRADEIGKYTRFKIVRGKAPRRVDQCLVPKATSGSRCPSG